MLQDYQKTFYTYLENYNRDAALSFVLELLTQDKITIPELYEQVIATSLNQIEVSRKQETEWVWQEHAMTNIARTVVECCFPYVLQQKNPETRHNRHHRVVVLCPEEEYHDIGARMGADYFTMENYEVVFVGANTPGSNILSLTEKLMPKWLAISVSNFYHLSSVKDTVAQLRKMPYSPGIILSGSAFKRTGMTPMDFGALALVNTYHQVQQLGGVEE